MLNLKLKILVFMIACTNTLSLNLARQDLGAQIMSNQTGPSSVSPAGGWLLSQSGSNSSQVQLLNASATLLNNQIYVEYLNDGTSTSVYMTTLNNAQYNTSDGVWFAIGFNDLK